MSDLQASFAPRAPFTGLPVIPAAGSGVVVHDRDGLSLASVLVRKGKADALTQRMRERFSIELPPGPRRATAGDFALMATGPGAWLATCQGSGGAFMQSLQESIGDLASLSDHSDGYAVLNLSGPNVRQALCKLVSVDVHPCAFQVGDVAVTVASHIGATLWRLEDGADRSAVFEIAVWRSHAASFWDALSESAAEFGFRVAQR